jgi:hypothetical protein
MRLIAFPQWDKLTSLLRGMARQSAADYAQVSAWHEWSKSPDETGKSSAMHKSRTASTPLQA